MATSKTGKKKATKTAPITEDVLTALVERVSPGDVLVNKPSYAVIQGKPGFEVTLETRSGSHGYIGETLADAAQAALHDLDVEPRPDPFVPSWRRLSRTQRELVEASLRELAAQQTARALKFKMDGNYRSVAAFEAADAYLAALELLHHLVLDENGVELPTERLDGEPWAIPIAFKPPGTPTH